MPELVKKETLVQAPQAPQAPVVTQFVMVKNYEGALAVMLDPHDFSTPARRVNFNFDVERQHVPAKYAVGTFVTDNAMKQMEKGYFTYENLDVLIKMAEDMGYYVPDSIKEPKISLKDLRQVILKGDAKELSKLMMNASRKNIDDLLSVAKRYYASLSTGMVQYIEKTYKASLAPISLNE